MIAATISSNDAVCKAAPSLSWYHWIDSLAAMETQRRDFKDRHARIVGLIRHYSFRLGRFEALFSYQKEIATLTGISEGNISTELRYLERQNVIGFEKERGIYWMRLNFEIWGIPIRYELTPEIRRLMLSLEHPDWQTFFPEPPTLNQALDALGLERLTTTNLPMRGSEPITADAIMRAELRDAAIRDGHRESATRANRNQSGDGAEVDSAPSFRQQQPASTGHHGRPSTTYQKSSEFPNRRQVPKLGTQPGNSPPENRVSPNNHRHTLESSQIGNSPLKTFNVSVLNESKSLNIETLKRTENRELAESEPWRNNPIDPEIIAMLRAVLGTSWPAWGGYWTNWVRLDPHFVQRLLGDLRDSSRVIHNPGGWMRKLIRETRGVETASEWWEKLQKKKQA